MLPVLNVSLSLHSKSSSCRDNWFRISCWRRRVEDEQETITLLYFCPEQEKDKNLFSFPPKKKKKEQRMSWALVLAGKWNRHRWIFQWEGKERLSFNRKISRDKTNVWRSGRNWWFLGGGTLRRRPRTRENVGLSWCPLVEQDHRQKLRSKGNKSAKRNCHHICFVFLTEL